MSDRQCKTHGTYLRPEGVECPACIKIQRDRYRAALERIRATLSCTDVPQDQWVKDLHGELFALASGALQEGGEK